MLKIVLESNPDGSGLKVSANAGIHPAAMVGILESAKSLIVNQMIGTPGGAPGVVAAPADALNQLPEPGVNGTRLRTDY